MTLKEYKEIYLKDETEYINLTRELAEAWLDDKIEAKRQAKAIMKEHDFELLGGEFLADEGEFEKRIKTCGFIEPADTNVYIYVGIEHLAEVLGVPLMRKKWSGNFNYKYVFEYKGVEIYEITDDELEGDIIFEG